VVEVRHRSRNHVARGQIVMAANDVSADPDNQAMLLRLGLSVGAINSGCIDRVAYVKHVAAVVVKARSLR
jgi:hypothetical protein